MLTKGCSATKEEEECCLLAGLWTYGRLLVFRPYVQLDKMLFPLFFPPLAPNVFCCFSNHEGAALFFFLFLSLPSSVLQ